MFWPSTETASPRPSILGAVAETPSAVRLQADSSLAACRGGHGRRRVLVAGTVPLAGVKTMERIASAVRVMWPGEFGGAARTAPANRTGAMPWLLGGAAPPIGESWAVAVDLMVGGASGGGMGEDGSGRLGGDEVPELGRTRRPRAEGTPAR
jgi:hypothetical protein